MVICPKCGYDNQLGRIFCHSCGAKLDLTEIKSASQGGKSLTKKGRGGVGKMLQRVVNIAIVVVVVTVIVLATQVPGIRPITISSDDLVGSDKKRAEMDGLAGLKTPSTVTITEAELNAFIQSVGFQGGQGGSMELVPTKLQLELGEGVVTAIFLGRLHIAGSVEKQVYLSYTGIPSVESGHFVFRCVGGALGSLPINPWFLEKTGLFDRYYGKVFARQAQEKQVLDSLSSISVSPKEVTLHYQPH